MTTTATVQTPPGPGGIAVITVAGPAAAEAVGTFFRPRPGSDSGPGRLELGNIFLQGHLLDEAIVARRCETIELNVHGGPVAVRAALRLLAAADVHVVSPCEQAPVALPWAHQRWDNPAIGRELLEALPRARSPRVVAMLAAQWSGGISELASEGIEHPSGDALAAGLRAAADGFRVAHRLIHPPEVVIVGPPNAGKSTLANALIGRSVSITHDLPGTTRDWVRDMALLDGLPVFLTDTAGLWSAANTDIDAEAVARAEHRAAAADLVLLSAEQPVPRPEFLTGSAVLSVATKADLGGDRTWSDVSVSTLTGDGLPQLRHAILAALGTDRAETRAPMAFTQRQRGLLMAAADAQEPTRQLRELLQGS